MTTVNSNSADENGWIIKDSQNSVVETADKLVGIIEKSPATLFARVDHAAGAKKAGLELGQAATLIFGAPAIGTPFMQGNIKAGLDLPIRVLIWADGSQTKIGYLAPTALKERYSIEGADEAVQKMTGTLDKFTDNAGK